MRKFLLISLMILLSTTGCESVQNIEDFKDVGDKTVTIEEVNIPEEIEEGINNTEEVIESNTEEKETIVKEEISKNSNIKDKGNNSKTTSSVQSNTTSNQSNNEVPNTKSEPIKSPETNTSSDNNDVEVNYTDNSNDLMYSITHGIGEYSSENECNSVGFKIKNNELDAVMDWNEANPDQMKQPVIKSSMCITVIKEGKEYWFLHFITVNGNNMDAELKKLYK